MSVRELSRRVFQSLWRGVFNKDQPSGLKTGVGGRGRGYQTSAIEHQAARPQANPENCEGSWSRQDRRRSAQVQGALSVPGKYDTLTSVRRTLIDNVLRRVTNTQAANLRRRAARYLTSDGNPESFLALVGVSLASGSGIITKEDEIEGICFEIRQACGRPLLPGAPINSKETMGTAANGDGTWSLLDFKFGEALAKGCSAVVYSAKLSSSEEEEYNLAVKMMFNYHAESNALTILRAMQRETVAARSVSLPPELTSAASQIGEMAKVAAHPNIVEILTVFADRVPSLPGDYQLYGDALPTRLNPYGAGRNMSLFLVMKRYDCNLREYLDRYRDQITPRISLVLLTQLLEGVAFLHKSGVSHRDLKSDNIMIDLSGGHEFPRLIITDFGCCLADKSNGLRLPYSSWDTDKGGNPALMAPEVALARPGTFTYINYDKSDLWTVGAIAYEIFGGENPFYGSNEKKGLQSTNYDMCDLPKFPCENYPVVRCLVEALLQREPRHRPSPKQAAAICQLVLWSPSWWIKEKRAVDSQEILQWLLTMTTKVLCESRWGNSVAALQEYQLVATFLATVSMANVRASVGWIQDQEVENLTV